MQFRFWVLAFCLDLLEGNQLCRDTDTGFLGWGVEACYTLEEKPGVLDFWFSLKQCAGKS